MSYQGTPAGETPKGRGLLSKVSRVQTIGDPEDLKNRPLSQEDRPSCFLIGRNRAQRIPAFAVILSLQDLGLDKLAWTSLIQENLRGLLDSLGIGVIEAAEKRERRAGLGDPDLCDSSMEDADGVNFVAEIFEGLEDSADFFGLLKVTAVDGGEHFLGEVGADTDATGGEAVDFEFGEVNDRRLLTDPTHDKARIDKFDEAGEVIVLGRILADNGVFDPGDEAVINKGGHGFGFEVAFELNVENCRFPKGFDELSEASRHSSISGEALHGQDHDGGEIEVLKDFGLIHHGAVSRTNGGNDKGVFGTFGRNDF
jgi:hypothetical protein